MLNWTENNFAKAFVETSRPRLLFVSMICAVLLPGLGFLLPALVSYLAYRGHVIKCRQEFSSFLRIFRQGVRAGCSLNQALELCMEHMKGPLALEIRMTLNEIRLGLSTIDAVRNFASRIGGPTAEKFSAAMTAGYITGGDITSALEDIAREADERSLQTRGEIFLYLRWLFLSAVVFFYLHSAVAILATVLGATVLAAGLLKIISVAVKAPAVTFATEPELKTADNAPSSPEEEVAVPALSAVSVPVHEAPVSSAKIVESFHELLANPAISEIVLNGDVNVTVVEHGVKTEGGYRFASRRQSSAALAEILAGCPFRLDEMNPVLSTPIEGNLFVDVILEPLALERFVKIRKLGYSAPESRLVIDEDNQNLRDLLRLVVECGANILISTEQGVATDEVFELIGGMVKSENRLAVLESQPWIKLDHDDIVRLRPRLANIEGNGAITMAHLSQTVWNLGAGTVIFPEGHGIEIAGCLSNAVRKGTQTFVGVTDVNARSAIESIVEREGANTRKMVSAGFDFIVHVSRSSDGASRITQLTEVWGIVGDVISTQDIFLFKELGFDKNRKVLGQTVPTGLIPNYVDRLERRGIVIPRNLFATRDR